MRLGPSAAALRTRFCLALLLVGLALIAGPAGAHPDLLEQIAQLDEQIARQPEQADLLVRRADLYRRHEDYAAALRDFAAARALQPHKREYDFAESRLLLETGDAAGADVLLSSYLEVQPQHAAAWNLRGHARLALQQPALAAQDYAQAIKASPAPTPVLYRQQAAALVAGGETHWPAAREAIDEGLQRHPRDVSLLGLATDLALAQANTTAAKDYIDRLPKGVESLPQWRRRIELAECVDGSGSAAGECLQTARTQLLMEVDTAQTSAGLDRG